MGIDLGDKRVGIAKGNLLLKIAFNNSYIERKNDDDLCKEIVSFVSQNEIEKIVIGLPLNMNGTVGDSALKVLQFIDKLKKFVDIPIITWDERCSTISAEKILIEADISRKKRKKLVDKISASIILQSYLDSLP